MFQGQCLGEWREQHLAQGPMFHLSFTLNATAVPRPLQLFFSYQDAGLVLIL